ncbi:MAG: hypothetical protein V3U53_06805 [bacterium]
MVGGSPERAIVILPFEAASAKGAPIRKNDNIIRTTITLRMNTPPPLLALPKEPKRMLKGQAPLCSLQQLEYPAKIRYYATTPKNEGQNRFFMLLAWLAGLIRREFLPVPMRRTNRANHGDIYENEH